MKLGKFKQSLLCGPIAPRDGVSRGGYETANRRTIGLLERSGGFVEELPYPDTLGMSQFAKTRAYALGFLSIRKHLIGRGDRCGMPFHFTPLFKRFILGEYLIIRCAQKLGYRIVLDLRAGNKLRDYARFGPPISAPV